MGRFALRDTYNSDILPRKGPGTPVLETTAAITVFLRV